MNEPPEILPAEAPPRKKKQRRKKVRLKRWDVRVWPTWLIVGVAWLIARLPLPVIARLASLLGALAYRFARARREITRTNLALCFPDWSDPERERLARESFTHTAMGLLESTTVWLNPGRDFASRTRIYDRERLEAARAKGRGVILLGGHFSALDVMGSGSGGTRSGRHLSGEQESGLGMAAGQRSKSLLRCGDRAL